MFKLTLTPVSQSAGKTKSNYELQLWGVKIKGNVPSQGLCAEEKCLHLVAAFWHLRAKSWREAWGQKKLYPAQRDAQCLQALPSYSGHQSSRAVSHIFVSYLSVAEVGRKLSQVSREGQWEVQWPHHGCPTQLVSFCPLSSTFPALNHTKQNFPALPSPPVKIFLQPLRSLALCFLEVLFSTTLLPV